MIMIINVFINNFSLTLILLGFFSKQHAKVNTNIDDVINASRIDFNIFYFST